MTSLINLFCGLVNRILDCCTSGPKFKTHLGQVRISYFHWNFVFFFNFFANLKSVKWNCHSSNQFWSLQHRVRNAWLQRYSIFFWQILNGTPCSVSALFRGYKIIFGNKQNAESSWFISHLLKNNFLCGKLTKSFIEIDENFVNTLLIKNTKFL